MPTDDTQLLARVQGFVTFEIAMNCIHRKKFHTEMRPQKWLIFGSGDALRALLLSPIVHLGPRSSAGHEVVAEGVPETSIGKVVSKDKHLLTGNVIFKLLENHSVESMYLLQQHAIGCTFLVTGPNPFWFVVPSPKSKSNRQYAYNIQPHGV